MGRNARNHEVSSGGEEKTHREHYARPERKEDRKERREAKQEVREKFQDERMKIRAELNTEYLTVPRQLKVKLAELKMLAKQNQDRGLKFQLPADLTAIEGRVNLIGDTYTENLRYSERLMNADLKVIRQTVRGLRVNLRRHTNHAEGTEEDHSQEPAQNTGPKRVEFLAGDPSKNMPKTADDIKDSQAQTGGSTDGAKDSSNKTTSDNPTTAEVTFDTPATPDPTSSTIGEVIIRTGAGSSSGGIDKPTIDIPAGGSSSTSGIDTTGIKERDLDGAPKEGSESQKLDQTILKALISELANIPEGLKENISLATWSDSNNENHMELYYEENGIKISAEVIVRDNKLVLVFNNNSYPEITFDQINQGEINPRNILQGLVETMTLVVDPKYKEIHAQMQKKLGIYEKALPLLFRIPSSNPNHEKKEKEKEIEAKLASLKEKIASNSLTENDLLEMDKLLESMMPKVQDAIVENKLDESAVKEQLINQEKDLKYILENYDKIRILHTQRSGESEVMLRYLDVFMPSQIKLNFYNSSFRNLWVLWRYPSKEHEKELLEVALIATQAQLKEL